jgi:hypothetical protein
MESYLAASKEPSKPTNREANPLKTTCVPRRCGSHGAAEPGSGDHTYIRELLPRCLYYLNLTSRSSERTVQRLTVDLGTC